MNVDNPGSNQPPKGFMAHILAASKEPADEAPAKVEAPEAASTAEPPNSSLDPTYTEPPSLEQLQKDFLAGAINAQSMAEILLGRAQALEKALLPFCLHGLMMSNARMCLMAMGRNDPAGGVWFSQPHQIRMQPNEKIFYDAIDAAGRARSEAHAMAVFDKLNEAKDAAAERDVHVAAGGNTH